MENRCTRLSASAYEELDARVQLLLRSEEVDRELPAVVCTQDAAWLEWQNRRFPILGRGSMVDEVVDIVEGVLHDDERRAEADPKTTENSAVAAGEPVLKRGGGAPPVPLPAASRADPVALRAADARGGGIAVGIETELASDTIGMATGPAFDFGSSVGPIMISGHEAFRFTTSGRQVMFMDFQVGVGYGAPLNPDARFGIVGRFGAEWMVAYPEGNSGQAAVAPVADLGLRIAHSFGMASLWLGIDARFRLGELRLRSLRPLVANDVGGSATLGVAFVDWSRK